MKDGSAALAAGDGDRSSAFCETQAPKKKTLIIRPIDLNKDAVALMDGAREFRSRVEFDSLFPPDSEFIEAVSRIVTLESVEILVAEFKGKVVGGIGLFYGPYMWNPKVTVADELFLWAQLDAPWKTGWKLFHQAMKNIEARGAIPMFTALESSPHGVEKMYLRSGLKKLETKFAKF